MHLPDSIQSQSATAYFLDFFFLLLDFLRLVFFFRDAAVEPFESVDELRFERFTFLCLRFLRRRSSESELESDEPESELDELLAALAAERDRRCLGAIAAAAAFALAEEAAAG